MVIAYIQSPYSDGEAIKSEVLALRLPRPIRRAQPPRSNRISHQKAQVEVHQDAGGGGGVVPGRVNLRKILPGAGGHVVAVGPEGSVVDSTTAGAELASLPLCGRTEAAEVIVVVVIAVAAVPPCKS